MANKDRDFGSDSQKNARLNGEYWRIANEVEEKECVFCDLKDKYIIQSTDSAVLTVNIFPYTNGQLMVIPRRHLVDISEITDDEMLTMHKLCCNGIDLLRSLDLDNVWVLLRNGSVAGKTVKHLHWNILPYTEGLNTWHYQEITLAPIDLAQKLRNKK